MSLVVGAGVVGCATAMELGKYSLRAAVIEAGEDVCTGTSKANSAIVHAGFDARPGSLMARFNVEGSHAMPRLCERLQIPFRRCGALVLCFNEADRPGLEELLLRGVKNGVHGLRIVEREELHELEPNVSPEAVAALYAPTSGIVCPFELTCAMAENAVRNGVEFFFDTCVESIAREDGLWKLETAKGSFEAPVVINAAGLHSAELNNMVSDKKITITPRKGEYMLLDKRSAACYRAPCSSCPPKWARRSRDADRPRQSPHGPDRRGCGRSRSDEHDRRGSRERHAAGEKERPLASRQPHDHELRRPSRACGEGRARFHYRRGRGRAGLFERRRH